jgi:hypothetical protein
VTQENVEDIERVLAAGNSGDFETMLALHHPAKEGVIPQEYPVAVTWRGLEGLRGFVEEWLTRGTSFASSQTRSLTGMTR